MTPTETIKEIVTQKYDISIHTTYDLFTFEKEWGEKGHLSYTELNTIHSESIECLLEDNIKRIIEQSFGTIINVDISKNEIIELLGTIDSYHFYFSKLVNKNNKSLTKEEQMEFDNGKEQFVQNFAIEVRVNDCNISTNILLDIFKNEGK